MSKNKLTQEQYKKAFDELQESTNKVDSLERLANDFDTTPKGLKLGLRIVFPESYNEWFKSDVPKDVGPTKEELTKQLIELTDYPKEKMDWLLSRTEKSSMPKEFLQHLLAELDTDKKEMNAMGEYIDGLRGLYHEELKRTEEGRNTRDHIYNFDDAGTDVPPIQWIMEDKEDAKLLQWELYRNSEEWMWEKWLGVPMVIWATLFALGIIGIIAWIFG